MRSRVALITLAVAATALAIPLAAHAQGFPFFGPIIGDNWNDCPLGWGAVLIVINNIIMLLITLTVVFVAPLVIAYAGFLLVVSAVNPEGKARAKGLLVNLIIGLVVALSAWLIVNMIMEALTGPFQTSQGQKEWFELITSGSLDECLAITTAPAPSPTPTPTPSPTPTPAPTGCPTCVSLSSLGLQCKSSSSCTAIPALADKLVTLSRNTSGWRVSEAYPPTVTHVAACHYNGSCVDAAFLSALPYNAPNVVNFMKTATAAGLRPVFETADCALRDTVRLQLGNSSAFCKTDNGFSHITGSHFSLYN